MQSRSRAFTLIELLAAIAIVGILASLLFIVVRGAMDSSDQTKCIANLRQLGSVALTYSVDHDGWLVPPRYWYAFDEEGYIPKTSDVWLCPTDTREVKTVWGQGPMSYGCNADQIGWVGSYWEQAKKQITQVSAPSQTVYFSDAEAYVMRYYNQMWVFRHKNVTINVVYFDGHTENLKLNDPMEFPEYISPETFR